MTPSNEIHELLEMYWKQKGNVSLTYERLAHTIKLRTQQSDMFREWLNKLPTAVNEQGQTVSAAENPKAWKDIHDKVIKTFTGSPKDGEAYVKELIGSTENPKRKMFQERMAEEMADKTNQQPIETSEREAKPFECNWQGQTPKPMLCDESCEYHCTENGTKPASCKKPTKEQLWQQANTIEQVIAVLRREQAKIQTQIESYE